MKIFNIENYEPAVQEWIKNYEWFAANMDCRDGDTFTNSLGRRYDVIQDSPSGKVDVRVYTDCPFGNCIRTIPKAILIV